MGDSQRAWELFSLINPMTHGDTAGRIATYRVEPYVVAADIYAVAPHTGRGGWTWYTGSAGWMYRLITESLLGLNLEVDKLRFAPAFPKVGQPSRSTIATVTLIIASLSISRGMERRSSEWWSMAANGPTRFVPLVDDRHDHHVEVELGSSVSSRRKRQGHANQPRRLSRFHDLEFG